MGTGRRAGPPSRHVLAARSRLHQVHARRGREGPRGEDSTLDAVDLAGLSVRARRLLLLLGRFDALTLGQAAAWLGRGLTTIHTARAELEARALVCRLQVYGGPESVPRVVLRLTPGGRAALRSAAGPPPPGRGARLARLDQTLAAVDLALALQRAGAGVWETWSARRLGHTAPRIPGAPPTGVLTGPDGTRTPVWIVLGRCPAPALRAAVWALYRLQEWEPGRIFAPAGLVPWLADLNTQAAITAWEPPHLAGRPPLGAGWRGRPAGGTGSGAPSGLGARKLDLLVFLDRFGYATVDQLARHAGVAAANVRRALAALERRGLARRRRERPGAWRGEAWSATGTGLRTLGSVRQPVARRPAHRRHSLALVDLALDLRDAGMGRWETERELGSERPLQAGLDRITPPDGRLTLADGRRVLIQLQLTRGSVAEQCRNAWRHRQRGVGDSVRFVCLPGVAPAYRRGIQPSERGFIEVVEWVPKDRAGRRRELDPALEARRRTAEARREQAGHAGG